MTNGNLVLNLSWLNTNSSNYAICESFKISFYRCVNGIHNVKLEKETDKLCDFLTANGIKFKKEKAVFDEEFWINFKLKVDTYLDVLHHIELRAIQL